jgi:hypothetical protein
MELVTIFIKILQDFLSALADENEWVIKKNLNDLELAHFSKKFPGKEILLISIELSKNDEVKSDFEALKSDEGKLNWLNQRKDEDSLIYFNKAESQPILISCNLSEFFISNPSFEKSEKVALLVSRLQKVFSSVNLDVLRKEISL